MAIYISRQCCLVAFGDHCKGCLESTRLKGEVFAPQFSSVLYMEISSWTYASQSI